MAKKPVKKSSEGSAKPAAKKAAPTKKAPAKAPAKATAVGGAAPLIDTNLAANAAAAFVGQKLNLNAPAAKKQESASFKQLKESMKKPHVQGLNSILETTNQNKQPSNLPTHGGKQVAHNQTYGADVTRSGVPRRTPG